MEFSKELLAKAKLAASVEELARLAEESGLGMSRDELEAKYRSMHGSGALSDEELDNVSGGCGDDDDEDDNKPEPPQPVMKNYDDRCDSFTRRSGGAGGDYAKFYTGTHCESCRYFATCTIEGYLDPNYDGNGYCFRGLY